MAKELLRQRGIDLHFYCTEKEQYEIGESHEGYEIKLDRWSERTERLGIEIGEKSSLSRTAFMPSGIMREDNTIFYVQGNFKEFWVFRKTALQNWYRTRQPKVIDNDPPTIQKFYLPIPNALLLADYSLMIRYGK